jgi:thiamine pyrophosphate-dependent acetolactate synthase large subunit-like protein
MWTTRHGELVGDGATVAQVDIEADAIGRHRAVDIGVVGDVAAVANVLDEQLRGRGTKRTAYRTTEIARRLSQERRWRDTPYEDLSDTTTIDPRTLTILLDDILPAERVLAVDSGNFMGYPSMFLSVPDENGMCFTQAFQSIGLGLATAVGAALARPDRLPVAALGDGGALMSIAELETVVRLALPMLIVVYDDSAYGAEVHHFRGRGHSLDTVTFPETDIAAIGRGFGCDGVTIRSRRDIEDVRRWVEGPQRHPLLIDAKVTRSRPSWWLEHAFAGH